MELAYSRVGPRAGTAEPLVLIHGIGHRRATWDGAVKQLRSQFDVISVDLPGCGASPDWEGPATLDDLVDCLIAQFATWGVDRPHVGGNSLGALLALELAARGHAASATAFNPAGFNNRVDRLGTWLALRGTRAQGRLPRPVLRVMLQPRFLRRRLGAIMYAHAERVPAKQLVDEVKGFADSSSFGQFLPIATRGKFAGRIDVPVTVAWGTKDRVYRHGLSRRAAKRLPAGFHVTMADTGHLLADHPEDAANIISATVQRTTD